jgi:DNA-binding NarL/FixJ family response regulator
VFPIRILVADDHQLMVEAVRSALADDPGFEIVAETTTGAEVVPLFESTGPDVVLLDVRMPGVDGLTCLEQIRERDEEAKVVILTALEDPLLVQAALELGACGFVSKRLEPAKLGPAIRMALKGDAPLVETASTSAEEDVDAVALTERQQSVLVALSRGLSNREIAGDLHVGEETVKFHLSTIYRKLGVSSRAEAVHLAYVRGLLGPDAPGGSTEPSPVIR